MVSVVAILSGVYTGRLNHLEGRRTHNERMVFRDVQSPLAQVVVHLHREHGEVLVEAEVHCVPRVEVRVGVDDVALCLRKSVAMCGEVRLWLLLVWTGVLHHLV